MESKIKRGKWEISVLLLRNKKKATYKVTRRVPELHVSETKVFSTKEKARDQLDEWLE